MEALQSGQSTRQLPAQEGGWRRCLRRAVRVRTEHPYDPEAPQDLIASFLLLPFRAYFSLQQR